MPEIMFTKPGLHYLPKAKVGRPGGGGEKKENAFSLLYDHFYSALLHAHVLRVRGKTKGF